MNGHPGGEKHTKQLTGLAALPQGARILDMGAGDGSAVRFLQKCGYEAAGVDLKPRSPEIMQGDFLKTEFPDGVFDGILSQCAFHVSGDVQGALGEAARLLKKGGKLMFSDVWFGEEADFGLLLEKNGFALLYLEDMTPIWKEYYIEGIWKGTTEPVCTGQGRCRYYAAVAERK